MNPTFIKTFLAAVAIDGGLFVKPTANRREVAVAAAETDAIIGVSDPLGAAAAGNIDVHQGGWPEVRAGGAIAAGDPLTANAAGRAVKAVVTSNAVVSVLGIAMTAAEDGDLFPMLFAPSFIAKPAA